MLTPAFEITQNENTITVVIKARFAKVSDAEIHVNGNIFKFYSKPYFLRLNLSGALIEDGSESAKYNVDDGSFTVVISKETKGEYFEGLDMLSMLLAPSGQSHINEACIEVTDSCENVDSHLVNNEENEDIDWEAIQTPYLDDEMVSLGNACYGFASKKSGVFNRLQKELCGIVDINEPDSTTLASRKKARINNENESFNEDHYLADLYEDETIQYLLGYKPPWENEYKQKQSNENEEHKKETNEEKEINDKIVQFTDDEKEQMRKLPRREIFHEKENDRTALLSLVDIIFAYAYNYRTTEGDNTVESAWTICKLSSTLSWLDSFSSLHDVVKASYRRSIIYPLYRHWALSTKVLSDVNKIFCLGRRRLLKCLLEIHHLLSHDDPRYILNELYITEYCLWIQSVSQRKLESVASALKKITVKKCDVGLELVELEEAAELVLQEEKDNDKQVPEVQQHGYPEILYTHATPSAVDQSIVITAENERMRSRHLVTNTGTDKTKERLQINHLNDFEMNDNEVLSCNNSDCGSNDEFVDYKELKQDTCCNGSITKTNIESEERVDLTAKVIEPLSALKIASDDAHECGQLASKDTDCFNTPAGQLDSEDTDCSDQGLIDWILKPPVKMIEMLDSGDS